MAKDVGAKQVIMASCAPPIRCASCLPFPHSPELMSPLPHRHSNVYGIDMPSRAELVAHGRTTEQVADAIGADLVIYQTLPDLVESVRALNPAIARFDCSVFTGEYITGGVDEIYLAGIERLRADNAREPAHVGALGFLEGKSGTSVGDAGVRQDIDADAGPVGSGAPMNGGDTIGLHNSFKQV
jgi:amidophosphoribosyltransferase